MKVDSIMPVGQKINAIVEVIQREGYVDYTPCLDNGRLMKASFCGVTAYFKEGVLLHLSTHDMDIHHIENEWVFKKGDESILVLWSNRLSRFGLSRIKTKSPKDTTIIAA